MVGDTGTNVVLGVIAFVLLLGLLAVIGVLRAKFRDRSVRQTRVGFFIERDRYGDEEEDDPEPDPSEQITREWPATPPQT